MDPAFTTTGIIATILAVIFATAALLVQRKKKRIESNNGQKSASKKQVHVSTSRHGNRKQADDDSDFIPDLKIPSENPNNSQEKKSDPPPGDKAVFKKYTAKGTREESPDLGDDEDILWE